MIIGTLLDYLKCLKIEGEKYGNCIYGFDDNWWSAGAIWFLVESFRESVLWGLGCFFFSPVSLVFLILHWDVAKKPFGLQLLGIALCVGGAIFADTGVLSSM